MHKMEEIAGMPLDKFFNIYKPIWINQLYHYCSGDMELINDIISDAMLSVLLNIDKYDPDRSAFSTWCFRIIINNAFQKHKIRKRMEFLTMEFSSLAELPYYEDDTEEEFFLIENKYNEVLALIDKLDYKTRIILKMKYLDNIPVKTIANELNINENTVRTICFNGRKKINRKLKCQLKTWTTDTKNITRQNI